MELAGLAEPAGLRARVATEPDAVRAEIASGRLILTPVWKAWRPALEAQGLDRATLSTILRGYGYELWLWAVGERTWAQCLEGLAGRVSRRVGARPPTKARPASTTKKATKTAKATKSAKATKAAKTKRAAGPARKTRRR